MILVLPFLTSFLIVIALVITGIGVVNTLFPKPGGKN